MKQGEGTETQKDGSTYEGPFETGKRHGHGKLTVIKNGKAMKPKPCDWYHGELVVKRKRTSPNGDEYNGTLKGKERHGQGTFTCYNGDYQQGLWLNDVFWEGQCKMRCGEGNQDLYEGSIKEGQRNGMGKLTRSSGVVEEGLWENGVLSKAV